MSRFCSKGHDTQICGRAKTYTCKTCQKLSRIKWELAHPGRNRELSRKSDLKIKYGMTEAERKDLLDRQSGLCPGCHSYFTDYSGACIDHCHRTKKVRGILCRIDNSVLGLVCEDSARLRRLADYLDKFKDK